MQFKLIGLVWGEDIAGQRRLLNTIARNLESQIEVFTQSDTGPYSEWAGVADALARCREIKAQEPLLVVPKVPGRTVPVLAALNTAIGEGFSVLSGDLLPTSKVTAQEHLFHVGHAVLSARASIPKVLETATAWARGQSKRRQNMATPNIKPGKHLDSARAKAAKVKNLRKRQSYSRIYEIMRKRNWLDLSFTEIAQELNDAGETTRQGKLFTRVQIERIFDWKNGGKKFHQQRTGEK